MVSDHPQLAPSLRKHSTTTTLPSFSSFLYNPPRHHNASPTRLPFSEHHLLPRAVICAFFYQIHEDPLIAQIRHISPSLRKTPAATNLDMLLKNYGFSLPPISCTSCYNNNRLSRHHHNATTPTHPHLLPHTHTTHLLLRRLLVHCHRF